MVKFNKSIKPIQVKKNNPKPSAQNTSSVKTNKPKKWIFLDPNFLGNRNYAIQLMEELKKSIWETIINLTV